MKPMKSAAVLMRVTCPRRRTSRWCERADRRWPQASLARLEELGSIGIAADDEGGPPRVEEISGFDGVVRFGGIGRALIDVISGFNAVERIEGTLVSSAQLTGFASLREVDGDLLVGGIDHGPLLERVGGSLRLGGSYDVVDVPNLREVGGDLVLDGTRATTLGFPALERVAGTLDVSGNSQLESWNGLAEDSRIEGDFLATFNNPIRNNSFLEWTQSGLVSIGGRTKVCANGTQGEEICNELDTNSS